MGCRVNFGNFLWKAIFIFPQKVLLNYANMGLTDIAEGAVDVVIVGQGRTAAKEFDGVFGNSLS